MLGVKKDTPPTPQKAQMPAPYRLRQAHGFVRSLSLTQIHMSLLRFCDYDCRSYTLSDTQVAQNNLHPSLTIGMQKLPTMLDTEQALQAVYNFGQGAILDIAAFFNVLLTNNSSTRSEETSAVELENFLLLTADHDPLGDGTCFYGALTHAICGKKRVYDSNSSPTVVDIGDQERKMCIAELKKDFASFIRGKLKREINEWDRATIRFECTHDRCYKNDGYTNGNDEQKCDMIPIHIMPSLFDKWLVGAKPMRQLSPEEHAILMKTHSNDIEKHQEWLPPDYFHEECQGGQYEYANAPNVLAHQFLLVEENRSTSLLGFGLKSNDGQPLFVANGPLAFALALSATSSPAVENYVGSFFDEEAAINATPNPTNEQLARLRQIFILKVEMLEPVLLLRHGMHFVCGKAMDGGERLLLALRIAVVYRNALQLYRETINFLVILRKHYDPVYHEAIQNKEIKYTATNVTINEMATALKDCIQPHQIAIVTYLTYETAHYMLMFIALWEQYTQDPTEVGLIQQFLGGDDSHYRQTLATLFKRIGI